MFRPDQLSMAKRALGYFMHTGFCLLYGIVCIVFYSLYSNTTCSESNILKLPNWLLGIGIFLIFTLIPKLSIFGIDKKIPAIIYYSDIYFISLPFHIIWSIIGSIVLFRDSSKCLAQEDVLWIWSLSTLICEWILIIVYSVDVLQKYRRI